MTVTAGFKWAPDIGPKMTSKTTKIAPVGIVFPRRVGLRYRLIESLHSASANDSGKQEGGFPLVSQRVSEFELLHGDQLSAIFFKLIKAGSPNLQVFL